MNSNKDFSDLFDEDFEITYEDESGVTPAFDEEQNAYRQRRGRRADTEEPDMDYNSGDVRADRREERVRTSRKRRGGVHLAAPIQKGGRTLSRISGIIVRQLSLILIAAVSVYVIYTFWRASVPYGDITESIRQKSFSLTLLAYLCVPAIFLLFEIVSFFWAMTRVRVRDAGGVYKEDTGRGLTSFIVIFAVSYLAFLFNRLIPESPEVLYGLKGALLVYGSMHNTLLGFCAAGVISCLVRRYMAR